MMGEMLHAAALLIEACALFAIWNWQRRSGSPIWLVVGGGTLIALLLAMGSLQQTSRPQRFLDFGAVYLVAALAWAWWFERLLGPYWKLGEVFVALLALIMVVLASVSAPSEVVAGFRLYDAAGGRCGGRQ